MIELGGREIVMWKNGWWVVGGGYVLAFIDGQGLF